MSEPRIQRDALWDLVDQADVEIRRAERTLEHATRAMYRLGCHCVRCQAAEAAYQRTRYRAKASGQPLPGQVVPAGLLWRRVDALLREGFTLADLAARARLHPDTLRRDHRRVTVRTYRRVLALYRRHCGNV